MTFLFTSDEKRIMSILWRHDPAFLMDCRGDTLTDLIAGGLAYVSREDKGGEAFVFLTEAGREAFRPYACACTKSS